MTLKIGIAGASGRIGRLLCKLIKEDKNSTVSCALVSKTSTFKCDKTETSTSCEKSDIWIDFSTPAAFEKVLQHCVSTKTPLVSGTTGLSKKHFREIDDAAGHIPVLWASNFSISINLIQQMLSRYTGLVDTSAVISETHHIHKKDMPSGTAITLARSIKPHGIVKKQNENEYLLDDISIRCHRQGDVPGIHTVRLDNDSENITIEHSAKNPEIFAIGAINVSKWLIRQESGHYTMNDYLESLA